jgi:DNA-binding NarL/FixJ family response regulator
MIHVAIYSDQPILAKGLESVIASDPALQLSATCSNIGKLAEHLDHEKPDLAVIDLTAEVTIAALDQLHNHAPDCKLILWTNSIVRHIALQALTIGVRGILRKTLSTEAHRQCLHRVVAGKFWLEKSLTASLLTARSVTLTPRESQLAVMLAQGLKNKEISHELGLSEGTVKVYLSHMFRKSGAKSRFDVALQALGTVAGDAGSNTLPGGPNLLVMYLAAEGKKPGV